MPGQGAIVLTVCEPFHELMARVGAGVLYWPERGMFDEVDAASEIGARDRRAEIHRPALSASRACQVAGSCAGSRRKHRDAGQAMRRKRKSSRQEGGGSR
jgi:hypothetical protein